jgi:hypothetical protein
MKIRRKENRKEGRMEGEEEEDQFNVSVSSVKWCISNSENSLNNCM